MAQKHILPAYCGLIFLIYLVESARGTAPSVCQAKVWSFPEDCKSPTNCTYQVMWRYKQLDDSIEFTVSSSNPDRWTGIIFSNEHNVTAADGIFAWIEENSYVMMDAHLPDFSQAISDNKQSVTNITAQLIDGVATFRFSRKRDTRDLEDISFADNVTCPYFIFPVDGGTVDYKTRTIVSNEHHPFISDKRVCVRPCDSSTPTSKPATSSISSSTSTTTTTTITTPRPPVTKSPRTTTTTPRPTTPRITSTTSTTTRPQTTSRSTTTTTTTTTTTLPPTTVTSTTTTPSTTATSSATTTIITTTTTTPQPQVPTSSTTSAPKTTSTSTPTTTTTTTTSTTSPSTTTTMTPAPPTSTQPQLVSFAESNQVLQSSAQSQQQQQWCAGRWSFPMSCRFRVPTPSDVVEYLQAPIDGSLQIRPLPIELSDCAYFAQWKFHEQSDSIEFIIQTKTRHRWTGIGFSNSTRMANSDAIIGLLEEHSGRHFIMDTWLRDHVMPELDQVQNIKQTSGRRENGTTTVRFWRSRITNDLYDFQFTDTSCAYFFFPTQGGPFNAISKRLHKHEVVPSVSQHKICMRACSAKSGGGGNLLSPPTFSTNQTGEPNVVDQQSTSTSQAGAATATEDSSSPSTGAPPVIALSSTPQLPSGTTTTTADKNRYSDSTSPTDASSPNDLSADLDDTPSSPSTALNSPGGQIPPGGISNPFSRLAFLSEPSLRWLAGIGCVAILLAMIVFQACFTIYRNKQAYKQNLYRQSAFKQNAYLHNAYLHGAGGAQHADAANYSSSGGGSTNTQSSNTATALTSAGGAGSAPGHHHHQQQHNTPVKRSHVVAAASGASAADHLDAMCAQQPAPHHHHRQQQHNHRRLPPRLADEHKLKRHEDEDEETLGEVEDDEGEEDQDMLDEEQEDLVGDYVEGDDGMGQSDDMMEDYSDDLDDGFDYPEGHYAHGAVGARQLIHPAQHQQHHHQQHLQGHAHRPHHAHQHQHHHQHATGHPHHAHHQHSIAATAAPSSNYQQRHYARGMVAAQPGAGHYHHHHHHHPHAHSPSTAMTSSLIRQNLSRPEASAAGSHYRSAGHLVAGGEPHLHAHPGGHHHRAQQLPMQQQPPHSHRSQLVGQPAAHHHHHTGGVHPAQRPDAYFLPSQRRYGRELD